MKHFVAVCYPLTPSLEVVLFVPVRNIYDCHSMSRFDRILSLCAVLYCTGVKMFKACPPHSLSPLCKEVTHTLTLSLSGVLSLLIYLFIFRESLLVT